MRYQRHIGNFHQQHAKEVIEELEKAVREMRIEQVILAGDETVIIPLLEKEMSKELAGKVAGTLRLHVNTPEHEVLEAAEQAIRQHDTLQDKKKIDYMNEHNYDEGIGLAGAGKTLTALLNGQVQELYISSDLENIEYDVKEIREILKDYAPGFEDEVPSPRNRAVVVDQLLRLAADSADNIRFIEDANLLKDAGGVGAILRYQAKGVSNL
jgi:peptide subunit release factor 1 (eRF1)